MDAKGGRVITIKHEWCCEVDGCETAHVDEFGYEPGEKPRVPQMPEGWMMVGDDLVCDKHTVCVFTILPADNDAMLDAQKRRVLETVFGPDVLFPEPQPILTYLGEGH